MKSEDLRKVAGGLRIAILKMIFAAASGHPGSSLSCVEILVALFWKVLQFDARDPQWPERDFFILSKGHAAPALYSVLAKHNFFKQEELWRLRQIGSLLQGHPTNKIPGIEVCTGSLGQGLSVASGIAMGLKIDGKPNRVFTLHGDGELQEGQIWEAAMTAAHHGLDNLVAIIDRNGLQIDGRTSQVCKVANVGEKFAAFGWKVVRCDGHDFQDLENALRQATAAQGKPVAVIAKTVKGKGIDFMEGQVGWHGKAPNQEEFELAMAQLAEFSS